MDPLEDNEDIVEPTTPPRARPFHLLNEHHEALPGEAPHEELADALRHARTLHCKVVIVKRSPEGGDTIMSYTGPGGWMGPKHKPSTHLSYGVPHRRKHSEGT